MKYSDDNADGRISRQHGLTQIYFLAPKEHSCRHRWWANLSWQSWWRMHLTMYSRFHAIPSVTIGLSQLSRPVPSSHIRYADYFWFLTFQSSFIKIVPQKITIYVLF